MKQTFTSVLLLNFFFCISITAFGQAEVQEKISLKFLKFLLDQKVEKAFQMFEPEIQEIVKIEDLKSISDSLVAHRLSSYSKLVLFRKGEIYTEGQLMYIYSFRWQEDVSKIIPAYLVTTIFRNKKSKQIAGLNLTAPPRQEPRGPEDEVSTSSSPEYQIASPTQWNIDGKTYEILDFSLIEFANKEAMLAVKVEYDFKSEDMDSKAAKVIGIPFAKMAYQNGMMDIAKEMAEKKGMTLVPEIGIALIRPKEFRGYRVRIEAKDYAE